jgi:hypothetical protein
MIRQLLGAFGLALKSDVEAATVKSLRTLPQEQFGDWVGDYKGFRARVGERCMNLFYVCDDGEERCCGQTHDFHAAVEWHIRSKLPTWMTKKPPAFSPYHDAEKARTTCAHGVPLTATCDPCVESYGCNRAM